MGTRLTRAALTIAIFCLPLAALADLKNLSSITYNASDGTRRIHVFADSPQAHMVENYFNGSTWQWIHHNAPAETGIFGFDLPRAITFLQDGTQRIYVFGHMTNIGLAVRYFNGAQWQWSTLPASAPDQFEPLSAVSFVDQTGHRRIYVFAVSWTGSASNHISTTFWDGSAWYAEAHKPTRTARMNWPPHAITYEVNGQPRVQVFCLASNGQAMPLTLRSLLWDGANWTWSDLGIEGFVPKSVVTYPDSGTQVIHIFGARAGNLYQYTWNGAFWAGSDLGKPAADNQGPRDVDALSFIDTGGVRKLFVATNFNDRLYWKTHDGLAWSSFTSNATNFVANDPSALSYPVRTERHIELFSASGDKLMRNHWNGASWKLFDNGSP